MSLYVIRETVCHPSLMFRVFLDNVITVEILNSVLQIHCSVTSCCGQQSCNVPYVTRCCRLPTDIHICPNVDSDSCCKELSRLTAQKSTHVVIGET
jgi:hypothetical protein